MSIARQFAPESCTRRYRPGTLPKEMAVLGDRILLYVPAMLRKVAGDTAVAAASGRRAGIPWLLHRPSVRCWSTSHLQIGRSYSRATDPQRIIVRPPRRPMEGNR